MTNNENPQISEALLDQIDLHICQKLRAVGLEADEVHVLAAVDNSHIEFKYKYTQCFDDVSEDFYLTTKTKNGIIKLQNKLQAHYLQTLCEKLKLTTCSDIGSEAHK